MFLLPNFTAYLIFASKTGAYPSGAAALSLGRLLSLSRDMKLNCKYLPCITNTLAYFSLMSAKMKKFISFAPGANVIKLSVHNLQIFEIS